MRTFSRLAHTARGRSGRQLVKLAIYSAGCLVVLAMLASRIGNIDYFTDRTTYEAALPDATGLLLNDDVKIAGVRVGKVTGIKVERGLAVVKFEVDDDVRLTRDTRVGVRWRNVIGQKYFYLHPGDGPRLRSGDRLPPDQAVQSADVGAFLNSIGPVLRAIDPQKANAFVRAFNQALDENEEKVRGLIADSADIATELGGADEEIGTLIGDLDTVVSGLAGRDDDLRLLLQRFHGMAEGMASGNDDLQLLVERFASVQGKLDELVERNRGNVDATVADLVTIAKVLAAHRDDLDRSLATFPQGLSVYHQISSYGQWFQIRAKITCLANQKSCSDEAITSETLSGGGPAGDAGDVVSFALSEPGL